MCLSPHVWGGQDQYSAGWVTGEGQKQTRSFTVDNCDFNKDFKGRISADTFHGPGRCGVESD